MRMMKPWLNGALITNKHQMTSRNLQTNSNNPILNVNTQRTVWFKFIVNILILKTAVPIRARTSLQFYLPQFCLNNF